MVAIVTGDLISSSTTGPKVWMPALKKFLKKQGATPREWEIYRGDAFQLMLRPDDALYKCIVLKSIIKQYPQLDVRLSIGIGNIDYKRERIAEANGSAFVRSGRRFDSLKKDKMTLAFATKDEKIDETLNLMARFATSIIDNWSVAAAQIVQINMEKPEMNQEQIARILRINQSAVSQTRKRSKLDLLLDFDKYYRNIIPLLKE